jgi:hypothetical protein
VAVFCSKESKGVKQYVINTANYFFDAPTTEMGEGRFFTRSLTERFVVVKTRLPHDQILTLLGPVLKKLQTEGR